MAVDAAVLLDDFAWELKVAADKDLLEGWDIVGAIYVCFPRLSCFQNPVIPLTPLEFVYSMVDSLPTNDKPLSGHEAVASDSD